MTLIFNRIALLLAFTVAITGCSLDSMITATPRVTPAPQKATVDPVPLPVAKSAVVQPQVKQASPVVEAEKIVPKVAPPVPAVSLPAASDAGQKNERLVNTSVSADLAYENDTLKEDAVWHGEVHVTGWLTVPPQVTLTIESGTIVRFTPAAGGDGGGAGLLVQGRLVAAGAADKQILFTGRYAQPAAADWQGIVLLATDKKNLLDMCRIEGAGVGLDVFYSQVTLRDLQVSSTATAIRLKDSYANVAGGGVSSCGIGIKSVDSELELRDMNISSNNSGMQVSGGSFYLTGATFYSNSQAALLAENSKLKVTGCSFTVNGTGVDLTGSEGTVSFNRFLSNRQAGINLAHSRIRVNGNNISQNGLTGLRISGSGNAAWGNVIAANNSHDLEYSGDGDLAVMGNWWGGIAPDRIPSRIRTDDRAGKVLYLPVLPNRPQSVL
jgi:hypothetical protein